jgi:hypothetical protein
MDSGLALRAPRNDKLIERALLPRPNSDFFIIFVDRIFTSLLQRPFTNDFDQLQRIDRAACLWRARHAD